MSKKKENFDNISLREQIKPIFKERFLEILGEIEYEKFVDIILRPQRKSFRINTLKVKDCNKLIENIKNKNIDISKIPWCENGFFINYNEDARSDLGNLVEHFLGKIYVQEATSMVPVLLLDIPEKINDDFKVLDMCASPGSKTTQIGTLMSNNGVLIANEIDYKRLGPLKINLERCGFTNVVITNMDGNSIEGDEVFDRIILDAPCSGSGVIRKSPKTIKTYNPKRLKSLQNLQLRLLNKAFSLLKKGGIMTYSTCSLDVEENEMVIDKFLTENDSAVLMPTKLEGLILKNKVYKFFDYEIPLKIVKNTIRIWPQDNDTNGFFVAKIKKE